MATIKSKSKTKKSVQSGVATIQSTFNNTIISLTDTDGEVLGQGSPSRVGFKGAKRRFKETITFNWRCKRKDRTSCNSFS